MEIKKAESIQADIIDTVAEMSLDEWLILLPGGSFHTQLPTFFVDSFGATFWQNTYISVTDERMGVVASESNFARLLGMAGMDKVISAGAQVVDPKSSDFSRLVDIHTTSKDHGLIVLTGMGEDGHIAGIITHEKLPRYFDYNKVINFDSSEISDKEEKYTKRLTISLAVFKSADWVGVIADTPDEIELLNNLQQDDYTREEVSSCPIMALAKIDSVNYYAAT